MSDGEDFVNGRLDFLFCHFVNRWRKQIFGIHIGAGILYNRCMTCDKNSSHKLLEITGNGVERRLGL